MSDLMSLFMREDVSNICMMSLLPGTETNTYYRGAGRVWTVLYIHANVMDAWKYRGSDGYIGEET